MEPAIPRLSLVHPELSGPPLSLAEASALFESRARELERRGDPRGACLRARRMQINAIDDLIARGAAGDAGEWLEALEIAHAQGFARALDAAERGDPAMLSAPWRAALAEADGRAALVSITSLVHTMYDLPLVIARIGAGSGAERVARAAAYDAATRTLAVQAPAHEAAVLRRAGSAPYQPQDGATADRVGERRRQAWRDGTALHDCDDAEEHRIVFKAIELQALLALRAATRPVAPEREPVQIDLWRRNRR